MTYHREPEIACSPARVFKEFEKAGYAPEVYKPFGPVGFWIKLGSLLKSQDVIALRSTLRPQITIGSIIVSQAEIEGDEWLHASITFRDRDPEYEELALLKKAVFGPKKFAYQVFPADNEHVNIHEHALHLWGRVDGKNVLPDFGFLGSI